MSAGWLQTGKTSAQMPVMSRERSNTHWLGVRACFACQAGIVVSVQAVILF